MAVSLLLLLATEAAVRVSGARAPRIDPPDAMRTRSLWQYDAAKGWSLKPGASAVTRHPSGLSRDEGLARINELGLRGPMPTIPKPAGCYRIVCVGDSYLFGAGIDEEHLFTSRLEKSLADSIGPRRLEVVNMGVSGYSTDQEYLLFRELGARLQPDLVLLVVCDNDFEQNTQDFAYGRYYKPIFEIDDAGTLLLTRDPVPRLGAWQQTKLWLARHSAAWNWVRSRKAQGTGGRWLVDRFQVGVPRVSSTDPLRVTLELVLAIRRETEVLGARLVVTHTGHRGENTPLVRALLKRLEERGIPTFRMDRLLAEARERAPEQNWDFGDDPHWNVPAHEGAARIASGRLRDLIEAR